MAIIKNPTIVMSGGGAPSGMYALEFVSDGTTIGYVYVTQGDSLAGNPFDISKTGYYLSGWSITQGGSEITYPYTPNADTTLYAVWGQQIKCIVSNLGSSSPSSVSFNKDLLFTTSGLGIDTDYVLGTDHFIKIPTMYRKVNTVSSNQITSFTIANTKIDDDYYPYPCFIKEDGETIMPYILIGKYWNTDANGCVSTTEAAAATMTINNGRTYARARGTGYQLFDWMMQRLWQDLIICFKETVNTNSGNGIGINDYDDLGIYWSITATLVDGIAANSGTWVFSYKPSYYTDNATSSTTNYVSAGYSQPMPDTNMNQTIQKLGYDSNNPFFNYPSAVITNSSYNSYYCDEYMHSIDGGVSYPCSIYVGELNARAGVFHCNPYPQWSTTYYRARLCYRPIGE